MNGWPDDRMTRWRDDMMTGCFADNWPYTVSSSAERGIMCDKILGPDTLNVDMGDFVWNNTASCKCRIWNEVQLISVCCPSLHFWLVINKIFWSWNWRALIWWAVCGLFKQVQHQGGVCTTVSNFRGFDRFLYKTYPYPAQLCLEDSVRYSDIQLWVDGVRPLASLAHLGDIKYFSISWK